MRTRIRPQRCCPVVARTRVTVSRGRIEEEQPGTPEQIEGARMRLLGHRFYPGHPNYGLSYLAIQERDASTPSNPSTP